MTLSVLVFICSRGCSPVTPETRYDGKAMQPGIVFSLRVGLQNLLKKVCEDGLCNELSFHDNPLF